MARVMQCSVPPLRHLERVDCLSNFRRFFKVHCSREGFVFQVKSTFYSHFSNISLFSCVSKWIKLGGDIDSFKFSVYYVISGRKVVTLFKSVYSAGQVGCGGGFRVITVFFFFFFFGKMCFK